MNNFLGTTILLCILLISLDAALYFFRKKKSAEVKSPNSNLLESLRKTTDWLGDKISGWSKPKAAAAPEPKISVTQPSTPVLAPESKTDSLSAMVTTSPPAAPTSPEKESADGNKTVTVQVAVTIPAGSKIHITLEVVDEQGKPSFSQVFDEGNVTASTSNSAQPARQVIPAQPKLASIQQFFSKIRRGLFSQAINLNTRVENLDRIFLLWAILIYALMVSVGLNRYPVYFFTDEAIHMNLAADFLRDGLKNYYGELWPTFFSIEGWVNGTSVYLQVLPMMLFGKSVIVTRLVSAFVSLLGALAAGLLLRDAFKFKYYWAGIFLVITTPAWFLHSRTAFEYVEVGSFYSIFLYFYSRYRAGYLQSFYWAIIAGALSFYTHGLGQILMGVTGLALFIVDFRYHIHPDRRKTILYGLLLGLILLLPFARYYFAHPGEAAAQVKRRGSYWVNLDFTLTQKLGQFFKQYVYGLSPTYWYFPNPIDLSRHIMDKYGNGLWITLPLVIVGLIKTFRNLRLPPYRLVLIALLACPIPASVVAIGMPRMLWMTFPLALLGAIGLFTIMDWAEARWRLRSTWIASGLFILLASLSIFILRDALVNGPVWFTDYSLYGMQYGAKQVFQDVVQTGLAKDPNRVYVVSPSWANGTEQFVAFFITPENRPRVSMGQPIDVIDFMKTNPPDLYFVATSDEYDKLVESPKFKDIKVDQVLPFPDGRPGFYVLTLKVVDNIDQIVAAEQNVQRKPIEDTMSLNGQVIRVLHSPLGSGQVSDVFDKNPDSLARVLRANPFVFDLYPTIPIDTHAVDIQTGSIPDFTVTISLYAPGANTPVTYVQNYKGLPPDPAVSIPFDQGPAKSERITIEIKDNSSGDSSQIHVRTIQFK